MALDQPNHTPTPEILAEITDRDSEEFELGDIEVPDLEDLDKVPADKFYSDEE